MNRRTKRPRPSPKPAPKAPVAAPRAPAPRPAAKPREVAPSAGGAALVHVPAACDFDRVDSTSMFDTLGGIRALPSHEASAALARRTLAELRGYEAADLMAIAEIGYHYLRSGGAKLAKVIFEGLTAIQPEEGYFWLALGLAHDHLDDLVAARAAYQKAGEVDPRDPVADLNLAELELAAGRRPAARRLVERGRQKAARTGQEALCRKADAMLTLMARGDRRPRLEAGRR